MTAIPAYAVATATSPLAPFPIERREPGPRDVQIDILYCGVCHSDLHQARDDWGGGIFPMVPGHEIVGRVSAVGGEVTKYKPGDAVGVGCFVDSCRECTHCRSGLEQHCNAGMTATYNGRERGTGAPTYGGYSTRIVVDEDYVLRIPDGMPLDAAAPLLCAGVTTYSPLRRFGVKSGDSVAVVGLGGLGHMAVKLAVAMGAEVTVLSTSESKRGDAMALGAHDFAATGDGAAFTTHAERFDLILDTVSAQHDYNAYLGLLEVEGTMVLLGMPAPSPLAAFPLVWRRRQLAGSLIGGIAETQETLDFCARHGIVSDIELIGIEAVNEAWERMLKGDVRYRFVIDIASLKG
jgi:uncharacterized zinc-type alcohol dehydrogenase-like protein